MLLVGKSVRQPYQGYSVKISNSAPQTYCHCKISYICTEIFNGASIMMTKEMF